MTEDINRRLKSLEDKQDKTDDRYIEIEKSLAEIKILLKNTVKLEETCNNKFQISDERIDSIEKKYAYISGAIAMIVFLFNIVPIILSWIK